VPTTTQTTSTQNEVKGTRWRKRVENPIRVTQAISPKLASNLARLPARTLGAVVVILRVAVALVVLESSETDDGLSVQPIFAVEDETVQDRLTVPLNPLVALVVIVEVPV